MIFFTSPNFPHYFSLFDWWCPVHFVRNILSSLFILCSPSLALALSLHPIASPTQLKACPLPITLLHLFDIAYLRNP
jgi:hypothetical protein